jgi:hypothetical protein
VPKKAGVLSLLPSKYLEVAAALVVVAGPVWGKLKLVLVLILAYKKWHSPADVVGREAGYEPSAGPRVPFAAVLFGFI